MNHTKVSLIEYDYHTCTIMWKIIVQLACRKSYRISPIK